MQELGKLSFKINVISDELEKHLSFIINNKLTFIDSFQFVSSSLDSLVKSLIKSDFKYWSQELDDSVLDPVKQKGFHPYEYRTNFEKFKGELPSNEKFPSSLTGKKISDKEYKKVLNVWEKIEMKTMKGYHDLYSKCDNLYSLEKVGEVEFSYISNRYTKDNNQHLKSYDSKQKSKHIIYLDKNNLYGYAVSNFFPTSGFKWINHKEFNLNKWTSNSSKGCVLEVDPE